MANLRSLAQDLERRRLRILFVSLLAYLVLYPVVQKSGSEFLAFRIFGSAVTVFSVFAVTFRRGAAVVALALAIPTIVQRVSLPPGDASVLSLTGTSISFVFDLVVIFVIFRRVFSTRQPNSEAIFGALCVYLLVGFSFANGYYLLWRLNPHAFYFDPVSNRYVVSGIFSFVYYSFGTITSLGAAGITPASDEARSLSIMEAILGVMYLAVLIARLMTLYDSHSARVKAAVEALAGEKHEQSSIPRSGKWG